MNNAQNLLLDLTGKKQTIQTETQFKVTWVTGETQEIQGTDIIDAFTKAGLSIEKMNDIQNWDYVKTRGSAMDQLALLAGVDESQTLEFRIDMMDEMDFYLINGNLPLDVVGMQKAGHDISGYKPPTIQEALEDFGWDEEDHKAILITGRHCPEFATKFLKGLLHIDVPVVYDIDDEDTIPRVVRQRMFKIPTTEEKDNGPS
ncbi:hypothetical protein NVP2275O_086 [Vibrio phage 2.275.O._10N.286.54.E11]|nr:hypothetical protein NVP2275O_086 [Vibrio phage 2.275.O._10N.286.54.E11]